MAHGASGVIADECVAVERLAVQIAQLHIAVHRLPLAAEDNPHGELMLVVFFIAECEQNALPVVDAAEAAVHPRAVVELHAASRRFDIGISFAFNLRNDGGQLAFLILILLLFLILRLLLILRFAGFFRRAGVFFALRFFLLLGLGFRRGLFRLGLLRRGLLRLGLLRRRLLWCGLLRRRLFRLGLFRLGLLRLGLLRLGLFRLGLLRLGLFRRGFRFWIGFRLRLGFGLGLRFRLDIHRLAAARLLLRARLFRAVRLVRLLLLALRVGMAGADRQFGVHHQHGGNQHGSGISLLHSGRSLSLIAHFDAFFHTLNVALCRFLGYEIVFGLWYTKTCDNLCKLSLS